jgi:hypothetical protein
LPVQRIGCSRELRSEPHDPHAQDAPQDMFQHEPPERYCPPAAATVVPRWSGQAGSGAPLGASRANRD